MADGTSVVSDRWGTSAGPRALRERSQYASRLRLPAAAENRRNCSQMSPCAGRLPSGRGPNADRPFDEPTTSTARRVAAATWMMSSTTVASRAYAVVPARRSRWSHGGASRPSSAPAAGSARHRADASRRDRAARSPDPQPASCRRSFRRGFRARAAPSTRHRRCPRPDQQPLSGCVGRDVLAGACVPNPGAAGAVPVRVRSRSSAGLRWTRGRLWHPRRQHRPLHTGPGSGDRCKGRRFAPRRMYVPGILSSQPSQVCLPSHGTVPERRANVQKGARPRGTDRRCSVPFRGSAGRRKDAGTRWLGCCPPERSTGETHPRAKRPMNRAKTPLRRRAAPFSDRPVAATWLSSAATWLWSAATWLSFAATCSWAFTPSCCSAGRLPTPVGRLFSAGPVAVPLSLGLFPSKSGSFRTPRVASRFGRAPRIAAPGPASGRLFLRRSCPLASMARPISGPAWRTVVLGVAGRARHVCSVRFSFSGSAGAFQMH